MYFPFINCLCQSVSILSISFLLVSVLNWVCKQIPALRTRRSPSSHNRRGLHAGLFLLPSRDQRVPASSEAAANGPVWCWAGCGWDWVDPPTLLWRGAVCAAAHRDQQYSYTRVHSTWTCIKKNQHSKLINRTVLCNQPIVLIGWSSCYFAIRG